MHFRYLLFLGWISYMLICSILLFTRGFLLSRQVLPAKSSCMNVEAYCPNYSLDCLDDSLDENSTTAKQKCSRKGLKVIVIIIDALRFDFLKHSSNKTAIYQNQVPIVNKLLSEKPKNAKLFEFIADPPTTTLQRLKGLTTGSLPTFIDMSSNFASPEIDEDNIIDQLLGMKKSIVFMGDDTWISAFPNRFTRQFPFPSFNVWDLDTVDSGIKTFLIPEIEKTDWQLLIAHFLGVDHCGHRHGPFHPEMVRKLNEMNQVIEETVRTMDNETLLFVIGDHGMTLTGDHGGDSEGEVTSALFVYSPETPLTRTTHHDKTAVKQIDFVPTLASIFGVPIPFSNLGSIIFESLPISLPKNSQNFEEVSLSWNNVKQVTHYIKEYSKTNQFSSQKLEFLNHNFERIKERLSKIDLSDRINVDSVLRENEQYLEQIRHMCQELWIQFDANAMSRGLVLTFLTLSFTFIIIEGLNFDSLLQVLSIKYLITRFSFVSLSIIIVLILKFCDLVNFSSVELAIYFFSTSVSILFLAIIIIQNWVDIAQTWYKTRKNVMQFCYRFIFFISTVTMFSNSFIVEEHSIFLYLIQSLLFLILWENRNKLSSSLEPSKKVKPFISSTLFKALTLLLILSAILRLSFNFNKCREEQAWCLSSSSQSSNGKDNFFFFKTTPVMVSSIIALALFVALVRNFLKMFGNLTGFSPTVLLSQYLPIIVVIFLSFYWLFELNPLSKRKKLITSWQLLMLPRIVFFFLGTFTLVLFLFPISIYLMKNRNNLTLNSPIPYLFQELKNLMKSESASNKEDKIVFGLATVYSSSFINFSSILCLLAAILLGYRHSVPAVLMVLFLILFTLLSAIIRNARKLVLLQLFHIGWPYIALWGFSSIFWFYGTGHQATFPSINWNSAFIGISSVEGVNFYLSALLVTGNTFISYIVHAALLPMLLIIPFTLDVTFPRILNTSSEQSVKKGDVVLFENEQLLYHSVFSLCAKYIIFHGFRVFLSMFAAAIHSRHLMVWKIFAPKFMFEAMSFILFTIPSLFVGFYLVIRITNKIEQVFKKIESE